ncbi:hypothetical protein ACFU53_08445 [Streptomyces sp. NPDC057474]|uniref:hypothetical protein n=1 Tax=Streptomyces sp. NPDC057474 TaxID=3346144 RepID=UPI0036BB2846
MGLERPEPGTEVVSSARRPTWSSSTRDPFTGPPEDIAATRALQTFVDGVRVHAAPDA